LTEVTKSSLAFERVSRIVQIVLKSLNSGNEYGPWTAADFDELLLLSQIAKNQLPSSFMALLKTSEFPRIARDQRTLAQRLDRAISVEAEFGSVPTENSAELLPTFKLKKKDRDRVLELCSKMRMIILASPMFDEAHRRRLLNRINAIEKQVNQEKGLLDVVLGGVSDVGDTLKKFGTDLKPLTDRMAEVKRITQSNSGEYQQIPAPEELDALPPPESAEK
jgi:hypothetical protein